MLTWNLTADLPYYSFYNYFRWGASKHSENSQALTAHVKAARTPKIKRYIEICLDRAECTGLDQFINPDCTLVPVPRSSPLMSNSPWPARAISEAFLQLGLIKEVIPCLARIAKVNKAAFQAGAESRPLVKNHYDTIQLTPNLDEPNLIILVDDIVTQGRTLYACKQRMQEIYTKTDIRCFTLLRACSKIISEFSI